METFNPNIMPPKKGHRLGRLPILVLAVSCLLLSAQTMLSARADADSSEHERLQEAQAHQLQLERAADRNLAAAQYDQALTAYAKAIAEFETLRSMNTGGDNRLENLNEKQELAFCHASKSGQTAFLDQKQQELAPMISGIQHTLKLMGNPDSAERAAGMVKMHVIIADYLLELKRYADAESEYMTVQRLTNDWQLDEKQDRDTTLLFYKGLGKVCHQAKRLPMAADYLSRAIAIRMQQVGDSGDLDMAYLELELAHVLVEQNEPTKSFKYLERSYYRQEVALQWAKQQAKLGDFVMGETALEIYRYYAHRLDCIMCETILDTGIARLSSGAQQYLHNTQAFFLPKKAEGYPQLPCFTPDKEE